MTSELNQIVKSSRDVIVCSTGVQSCCAEPLCSEAGGTCVIAGVTCDNGVEAICPSGFSCCLDAACPGLGVAECIPNLDTCDVPVSGICPALQQCCQVTESLCSGTCTELVRAMTAFGFLDP